MFSDDVILKNRIEIDKKVKEMEKKYKKKIVWDFVFTTIIGFFQFILPYLIIFSWWSGMVGFTIYLIFVMCMALSVTRDTWKKEYLEQMDYEEGQIRFENDLSSKFNAFLYEGGNLVHTVLQEVGEKLEREYFGVNETRKQYLPGIPFDNLYKTVKVDNDERLPIIKDELRLIQSYNPSSIVSKLRNYSYMMESYEVKPFVSSPMMQNHQVKQIPLSPIQSILVKRSIDKETIDKKLQEAIMFQSIYENAKEELEADEGRISAGLNGERFVNKELEMYNNIWTNISNVRFEVDGQTVESDNIIVSTKGIFTLEVKNYSPKGTYSMHITKDGQWLKVLSNGHTEPMKDVATQMNRHIIYKQKLINAEWNKKYGKTTPLNLFPIFVLGNDTIRIQNDSDLPIMRVSNIYHHIMKFPDILTPEEVQQICSIIRENSLPVKKYPLKTYSEGFEKAYSVLVEIGEHMDKNIPFVTKYVDKGISELASKHMFK